MIGIKPTAIKLTPTMNKSRVPIKIPPRTANLRDRRTRGMRKKTNPAFPAKIAPKIMSFLLWKKHM